MKIWMSPYELEPHEVLNGVHHSLKGVLLKLQSSEGLKAYSLYHPIETVGDVSLKNFLKDLRDEGEKQKFFSQIKELSVSEGDLVLSKNQKVKVYYSCASIPSLLKSRNLIKDMGFETVKIKVSNLSEINSYLNILRESPFNYIFDFNGKESSSNFLKIDSPLKSFFKERLLYVEDPYKEKEKSSYVKLASDFIGYEGLEDFVVLKPTGFNHSAKNKIEKEIVVTSYLDHPLGQIASALWILKNSKKQSIKNESGLYSHTYYKLNKYSELFKREACLDVSVLSDFLGLLEREDWRVV